MKFGSVLLSDAEGAILAHAVSLPGGRLKKGRLLSGPDIDALVDLGIQSIVVARLEAGDVPEDEAAARVAARLTGSNVLAEAPFTGRVNLHAIRSGLLLLDRAVVDRLNRIDESITIATLPAFAEVRPRQMVATIKIIPFAATERSVRAWEEADGSLAAIGVAPFSPRRVALLQTTLPGLKASVLDKTATVTSRRLESYGSTLQDERRCAHEPDAVAVEMNGLIASGIELVLIAGASAIIDRRDVIPAGIEQAGGRIAHFGMPVDPGNLMLTAWIGGIPVLGLPGCARSPKHNGFDWVLQRLLAGLPVGSEDLMGMGVGGLLAETPVRGQPRSNLAMDAKEPAPPRVAALVLAAGRSSRMGTNKLLIALDDGRRLIEHVVDTVIEAGAEPVIVVLGHEAVALRAALADRPVTIIENPAYGDGLSSSLRAGIRALPRGTDGFFVCLGDMPAVQPTLLRRMAAAFVAAAARGIVVPIRHGRRGNPVLWDAGFIPELMETTGDIGAKHLIGLHADRIIEVEGEDDGIFIDLDTPASLDHYRDGGRP